MMVKKKKEKKNCPLCAKHNARQVWKWDDVTDKEVEDFYDAVWKLRDHMIPDDLDGDSAINIKFIDRRRNGPDSYFEVPYEHKAQTPEEMAAVESALLANLDIALAAVNRFRRIQQMRTPKLAE